jgi:hypothetical protein
MQNWYKDINTLTLIKPFTLCATLALTRGDSRGCEGNRSGLRRVTRLRPDRPILRRYDAGS